MSSYQRHNQSDHSGHSAQGRATQNLGAVLLDGLVAGAVGVAAMTISEKLEQAFTKRPNSFVPGHTLERLLRLPSKPDHERFGLNWAMHWG